MSRLDAKTVLFIIAAVLIATLSICSYVQTEMGRVRVADCKNNTSLFTPNDHVTDWCLRERLSSTWTDSDGYYHNSSYWVDVVCFPDKVDAIKACETGMYFK